MSFRCDYCGYATEPGERKHLIVVSLYRDGETAKENKACTNCAEKREFPAPTQLTQPHPSFLRKVRRNINQ